MIYKLITENQYEIYFSQELLDEYKNVITRKKFKKYIKWSQARRFIKLILPLLNEIEISSTVEQSRDKKDNYLLSMSIDAQVDFLVTGDPDLLVIKKIGKTRIINMREFQNLNLNS